MTTNSMKAIFKYWTSKRKEVIADSRKKMSQKAIIMVTKTNRRSTLKKANKTTTFNL